MAMRTRPLSSFTVPCPECDWYVQAQADSGVGEKAARLMTEHVRDVHGKDWPEWR